MKPSTHQLKWLSAIVGTAALVCAVFQFQSSHPEPKSEAGELRRHSKVAASPSFTVAGAPVEKNSARTDGIDHPSTGTRRSPATSLTPAIGPLQAGQKRHPMVRPSTSSERLSKPPAADSGVFRPPLFFLLDDGQITARIPSLTAKAIQKLRDDFTEEAGIDLFPPGDPAYAERWRQAELSLEKKMRLWYGWNAWSSFQHQAAVQANAASE